MVDVGSMICIIKRKHPFIIPHTNIFSLKFYKFYILHCILPSNRPFITKYNNLSTLHFHESLHFVQGTLGFFVSFLLLC